MSIVTLEHEILEELRAVTKNRTMKLKNIMEWSTGKVVAQEGETLTRLPKLKINVAWKIK